MSYLNLTPIPAGGDTGIPPFTDKPESGYSGPTMGWLLQNHKLAHQIIATHPLGPSGNILDAHELALLRMYVSDPSPDGAKRLLVGRGLEGDKQGSLVGHAIASGSFDDEEVEMLKGWFRSGVLDKELEGVEPSGNSTDA